MNISFHQLTTTQLLLKPVTELLLKQHNLVLVSATASFEMAQQKKLPYLLHPKYVAQDLASLMEDDHSALEHYIGPERVVYKPGTYLLCAVGTPSCLEEFHQKAKHCSRDSTPHLPSPPRTPLCSRR